LSKKDNDPIGHTAIKLYFNLTGGEQHECQEIWNPSKFPSEISDKLKDFDKYWGKTFAKHLQDDDLNYIISNGPDEWKHRALKVILDRFDGGYLDLRGLTSLPADVKFPEKVGGYLDLRGLTSLPADVKFPKECGYLDLSGLTSLPADVKFPKECGYLDLRGLTSLPKGMKLPSYAHAPNLGENK
jgi:hypothetical protein